MTLVKVNSPLSKSIDGFMKDFLSEFPSTVSKTFREDVLHFPPVNIKETPQAYLVDLSVPGYEKTDFKISLEENVLTVSSEKKTEDIKEEGNKTIKTEFSYKSFKRSFTIDDKIDAENISAKYDNGILKLNLPRKEVIKQGSKEINIL